MRNIFVNMACAIAALSATPALANAAKSGHEGHRAGTMEERSYEAYHYAPAVRAGDLLILSGVVAAMPPR